MDRATLFNEKSTISHCTPSFITRQRASVDNKLLYTPRNVGYYHIFEGGKNYLNHTILPLLLISIHYLCDFQHISDFRSAPIFYSNRRTINAAIIRYKRRAFSYGPCVCVCVFVLVTSIILICLHGSTWFVGTQVSLDLSRTVLTKLSYLRNLDTFFRNFVQNSLILPRPVANANSRRPTTVDC